MATATTRTEPKAAEAGARPYRLSVAKFVNAIAAGVFTDEDRVELLEGQLVERMVKNDPHDSVVSTLAERLRGLVAGIGCVREEKSLKLGRWSRPEPDIAVVRGMHAEYLHRKKGPQTQDALLIVEVADSTYAKDHGRLLRIYAAAGIPIYWIVNLPARRIEIYSGPKGRGRSARYQECVNYDETAAAPVVIEGRELGRVPVREVLP